MCPPACVSVYVCIHEYMSVCVCVCVRERERERQTDRETDRQTDRQRSHWHGPYVLHVCTLLPYDHCVPSGMILKYPRLIIGQVKKERS